MRASEEKVNSDHLKRNAYLYVRQSTARQVLENVESTERQYELRRQAAALGWPETPIIVIDSALGQSGASSADRAGFQRLVTEVSMGRAGMVLGLEVSIKLNGGSWQCRFRSVWSTTPAKRLSWIPINRYNKACVWSLKHSAAPDRHLPWSRRFAMRACCFPAVIEAVLTMRRYSGGN